MKWMSAIPLFFLMQIKHHYINTYFITLYICIVTIEIHRICISMIVTMLSIHLVRGLGRVVGHAFQCCHLTSPDDTIVYFLMT